ncbi:anthranilate synthase family protein [Micromonospora sp. NPDC005215]|uniref:anthranilate synthase family protein n=1 Tax=Micromonospora sp. NPDC005215 TaxID=3157024 RepID=UPI0033BB9415
MGDWYERVTGPDPAPFALLARPDAGGPDVELLEGRIRLTDTLAGLPLPADGPPGAHEVLALLPYRQLTERGFACVDDGEPIRALIVDRHRRLPLPEVLRRLPAEPVAWTEAGFDVDDERYGEMVASVIAEEIGSGAGSNFVIRRDFRASVEGGPVPAALALFARLLRAEAGAYWTFLVHCGDRTLVGATPERHVSLDAGRIAMTPISGTYRYQAGGAEVSGLLGFLADTKETDELYMVVDEELKMMARLCPDGGRVVGPFLREMAHLAHTEYRIEGEGPEDVRRILRETMFAPTVTGSPLENACRVIAAREPGGRGYYAGVAALIGRDDAGRHRMDSAILIRTADVDRAGGVRIGVGATLVRHSDPAAEAAETRAKVSGLLGAATPGAGAGVGQGGRGAARPGLAEDSRVRASLRARNSGLSDFWFAGPSRRELSRPALTGMPTLVVDAEDSFTAMLARQLRSLGLRVRVRPAERVDDDVLRESAFVVLGPGPGDPRDSGDPRIVWMRHLARRVFDSGRPFLAVCLSHQLVAGILGLPLARGQRPDQGRRRTVDLFGRDRRVGFYNTFAAYADADLLPGVTRRGAVLVSRDAGTGRVHALRGQGFTSLQFHPESLLTEDGPDILAESVEWAISRAAVRPGVPAAARNVEVTR